MKRTTFLLTVLTVFLCCCATVMVSAENAVPNGAIENALKPRIILNGSQISCGIVTTLKSGCSADLALSLQMKTEAGYWKTIKTMTDTNIRQLSFTYSVSAGTYRVKASAIVYDVNHQVVDRLTKYSRTVTY